MTTVEDVNAQKIIPGKGRVSGVIGDIRSDLTSYEALMTSSVGISQCSFASASTTLSDVEAYPYFFRTIPTITAALDAILVLLKHLGWRRVMVIYDLEYLGYAGQCQEYLSSKARSMGIYILANQPLTAAGVPLDPTFGFLKNTIQSTASRIQILLAAARFQRDILREMRESGYMGPDYAWVTTNNLAEHYWMTEPQVEGYDGLIMLDTVWNLHGYPPFDSFLAKWLRLNVTEYPGAGDEEVENDEGAAYSCLVRQKLEDKSSFQTDQEVLRDFMSGYHTSDIHVIKYFQTRTYEGPAGPITLDENGDQKYGLYNAFSLQDGKSIPFAFISDSKYTVIQVPPFKKSHPTLPKDAPPWAIQNPTWFNARGIAYGTLCSIAILLTLLSAFLVYTLRDNIIIKAASPTFCLCELLGILLVFIWCIMMVGVPKTARCTTQSLLLPTGITLLAGSLTIKNYRIYRIFNSVNVANQAFQTRLLLRFVLLAVLLALIPVIIETVLDVPHPHTINIHADQWIRCRGQRHDNWWLLASTIVPLLLVLFGVFLAFKTRNVVYLWNEARQISLVLYNIFFFTLIIVISLFFPDDLYTASFYIEICGIFFTTLLALYVLFYPRFMKIWRAYERGRHQNALNGHWQPNQHHRSHHKLRRPGDITTGIDPGDFMGINTTAFLHVPDTGAPDAVTTNGNVVEMPSKKRDSTASTGTRAIAVTDSSSSTAREVILKGKQRERPLKRGLSSNSSLGDRLPSVNQMDWWMNTSVPIQRIASSTLSAQGGGPCTDSWLDEQFLRGTFMDERDFQETLRRRSVERELDNGGEGSSAGILLGRPHHVTFKPPSGDMHVFDEEPSQLAPVDALIGDNDTPSELEAYACTDGKSRSHLMVSMTQVVVENEPAIRVETCHSGTLLIRFQSQARLDSWLRVFSPPDLAVLMPTSLNVPPLNSNVHSTGGIEDPCDGATSSSLRVRGNNHLPMVTQRRSLSKQDRTDISKEKMPQVAEGSNSDMSEVDELPTITTTGPIPYAAGKDASVGMRTESETLPGLDQTQSPQQALQPQTWNDHSDSVSYSSDILKASHGDSSIIPGRDAQQRSTDHDTMVTASSPQIEAPIPLQVHPLISVTPAMSTSDNAIAQARIAEQDDNDDDLYDPEFGIGGNGRRRFHKRCSLINQSRLSCSPGRVGSSAVPTQRLTKSANASPSLPHPGTIPSPAVISAAAAAVSAGWSESDALSAAMADPNGDFLKALSADKSDDAQGHRDPRALLHSHSADNASTASTVRNKRHSLSPRSLFADSASAASKVSKKRHSLSPRSLFADSASAASKVSNKRHSLSPLSLFGRQRQSVVEGGRYRRNSTGRSHSHSPPLPQSEEDHL
ncbi:hypothetical protein EC968_001950 [Mortierella alpina]|nr:hypothetical protein EC968_001950 [Mortierella alpina]